ncbi:MAG: glycosyltransferase [Pseudomonadota bacterium]
MIFVTVGTQMPFDRLVMAVDAWAEGRPDVEAFAQIGPGRAPTHMPHTATLTPSAFSSRFARAKLVIAHAGTGSVLAAMEHDVPIIIVPRSAALGEHRDDHQMATAKHFAGRAGVHVVTDTSDLGGAINQLLTMPRVGAKGAAQADPNLLSTIRQVIFPQ